MGCFNENVSQFYNQIMDEKDNNIEVFKQNTKNFFNDLGIFVSLHDHYERELDCFTSYRFNIFKYININENLISGIIVDILNPKGEHGQGTLFLDMFLDVIKLPHRQKLPSINTEVLTRQHINSLRRMDILIDYTDFGIMIENKPRYDDKTDQLKDYAEDLRNKYGRENFMMVYLSNDGHFPDTHSISKEFREELVSLNQFVHITYGIEFKRWLEDCINKCQSERYRWFLKDFINYIIFNYI